MCLNIQATMITKKLDEIGSLLEYGNNGNEQSLFSLYAILKGTRYLV